VRYTNNNGAAAPYTEPPMNTRTAMARDPQVGALAKPG